MAIAKACPIPAAQELLDYIRNSEHKTVTAFSEAKGLDRLKVARALKGGLLRVDVDFAFDIEEATEGHVRAESWRMDDELKKEMSERRKVEAEAKKAKAGEQ